MADAMGSVLTGNIVRELAICGASPNSCPERDFYGLQWIWYGMKTVEDKGIAKNGEMLTPQARRILHHLLEVTNEF